MFGIGEVLVAQAAFTRARAGEGPSLIECKTYRHSGHSRADPGAVGSQWKATCINAARRVSVRLGEGSPDDRLTA